MTTIIATVGPATRRRGNLGDAVVAGATGFRFSVSKMPPNELRDAVHLAVEAGRSAGRELDLWIDLPGRKARLSNPEPIALTDVPRLRVFYSDGTRTQEAHDLIVSDPAFGRYVQEGDIVAWGDGEEAGRVVLVDDQSCQIVPLTRGVLGPHKGIAIIGRPLPHESLTQADAATLAAISDVPVTGVVMSFVESSSTVGETRELLRASGSPDRSVIAKIETCAGVAAAHDIADAADAVLLGRGDLLLETGEVEFHHACREVLEACREAGTPVVIGTQLFAGLDDTWLAHRSDLAYASLMVEQGVDGLMLAAETTVSRDPRRAIGTLAALVLRYSGAPPRALATP